MKYIERKTAYTALLILILALNIPYVGAVPPGDVDSYSEANQNGELWVSALHPSAGGSYSAVGQSFTANGTDYNITSVKFYLRKTGAPKGNAHAVLYAHSGTFGTNSTPTSPALATSDGVNVSTFGAGLALVSFNFTGANQVTLTNGTKYCIAYENPAAGTINGANYVRIGSDTTAPTHPGTPFWYDTGAWHDFSSDIPFYVYGISPPQHTGKASDSIISKDEAGWVNITVYDRDNVANLNYMDLQVNTTGDTESFTLRWTQSTGVFSEQSDPDNICLLNTSTRVNVDAWTDRICFNFTMTGGASGLCDIKVYTIDDDGLSDLDVYNSQFEFSYFNWLDEVYDFIDSAFSMFGVTGFMTQITTFVTNLGAYFADSITHLWTLTYQQLRIVMAVFTWFSYWVTEFVDLFLDLSTFLHELFDGTHALMNWFGSWWDYFNWDAWKEAVPLLLFIFWYDSLIKRGKQTAGGEMQVFVNDINTAINILSYFFTIFSFVVNTVIDRAYGLFDAIV